MSARQLRKVPYNGNRAYKYYLDGYKVNGKRRRLFFRDEAAANRKFAELARQQKKEGQDGLDIPLNRRVMAAKAARRLAPFNRSILDAAEFYASELERESGLILVSDAIEDYLSTGCHTPELASCVAERWASLPQGYRSIAVRHQDDALAAECVSA